MQFTRIYNEKSFDSRHDIAVSLTFSIFNPVSSCSGGFTIAFYEDALISPYGGGVNQSLGYAPYSGSLGQYEGLKGAHLGVGFDVTGGFSKKGEGKIDGDYKLNPNTIAIRGQEKDNFPILTYTENLSASYGIGLSQGYTNESDATDLTFRLVLTEHGRLLKVQKQIYADSFIDIASAYTPEKKETAYRVVCSFVSPETNTVFKIKEFNCYGFEKNLSSTFYNTDFAGCTQFIRQNNFGTGESKKLFFGSNNIFAENPVNKSFKNFILTTSLIAPYDLRQTVSYPFNAIHNFIDSHSDIVLAKNSLDSSVDLYRNQGRNIIYAYNIPSNGDSNFAYKGSIDKDHIYLTTFSTVEVYKRNNYDWNFLTSLSLPATASNIKFRNNQGIISYSNGDVEIYEKDSLENFTLVYSITGLSNSSEWFGHSIAMGDYFAAIGAPKKSCLYSNDGAVFIFTKNETTGSWSFSNVLSAGDNPDANFGYALGISNNLLAVGIPGNTVALNSNAGLLDVYEYASNTESILLKNTYPPIDLVPNFYLGSELDIYENLLTARSNNAINVYNLNCPPSYVPPAVVPPCAITLLTPFPVTYLKKIDTSGYILTIQCPKPPVVPLSAYCALVSIVDSGIPLYSINGYDILSPIFCVVSGSP